MNTNMRRRLVANLPEFAKEPLKRIREYAGKLPYCGIGRFCPVCGKSSNRFREAGIVLREDAQCIHCNALERHRLFWLYILKKTDLFDGRPKTMLHVAPEPFLNHNLENVSGITISPLI